MEVSDATTLRTREAVGEWVRLVAADAGHRAARELDFESAVRRADPAVGDVATGLGNGDLTKTGPVATEYDPTMILNRTLISARAELMSFASSEEEVHEGCADSERSGPSVWGAG